MTADRWTRAVVRQLGLGRLLPLGHRGDGAWITEEAARTVLRRAADAVPGVRVGALRVSLADPGRTYEPAVPPPPGALPPGPLRVTGEFAASADPSAPGGEPLPAVAARLRSALGTAATERLGLMVTEVDLRVTALLDTGTPAPLSGPGPSSGSDPADGSEPADGWNQADGLTPAGGPDPVAGPGAVDEPVSSEAARVAAAVLSVPGWTVSRARWGVRSTSRRSALRTSHCRAAMSGWRWRSRPRNARPTWLGRSGSPSPRPCRTSRR